MLPFRFVRLALTFFALMLVQQAQSQSSAVRQAEKKMSQSNWPAARQLLRKATQKDTINTEAELLLTRWFLNEANPDRHIDSAYAHNLLALVDFQRSSPRQKDRLKKNKIDSTSLLRLRAAIDSLAFAKAKDINTETAYINFLSRHPSATQQAVAIELRDEVAFLNALRENTYASFDTYLQRYPQSHRVKEAKDKYEKLLFEAHTKDRKLASYKLFLKKFPASPYRVVAEKNIFQITTSIGAPEDFAQFISDYPQSVYARFASDLLFHLVRDNDEKKSLLVYSDSLRGVIDINRLIWIPVYKNDRYGFINSGGTETLAPQFENISEEYKCGAIKEDVLLVNHGVISRSGKVLAAAAHSMKALGFGFLSVGDSGCFRVLHKSGRWIVNECVQEAKLLEGRFLTVRKNNAWGLYALNGRQLLDFLYNVIEFTDGLVMLDRGKKSLCTLDELALLADGNALTEKFVFDKITSLGQGRWLVTNGSLEGIINSQLEFVVPLARQSLIQMPFGLTRKINDKFIFNDLTSEMENKSWDKFQFYRQWLLVKNGDNQKLVDTFVKKIVEENPDSLWFANGLALARNKDSVRVHINSTASVTLPILAKLSFIKSPDSIRYFFTEVRNKKAVFSIETGEKLFNIDVDQIESLTPEVFVVTKKNKKGLISRSGKNILPFEYDALLLHEGKLVSLLKEKKFGLFDLASARLIKPVFERNILLLDSTLLIVFKGGYYGVMDWTTKPVTAFEFDEIQSWKKNEVWGKKGFEWKLIDLVSKKTMLSQVKKFTLIKNTPAEKIAIVQQENYFGVLSSRQGLIIPATFSVVNNLGDEEEPIYFTAKEVEEAGIMVVIYYDRQGKFIRKQVYEEDEYNNIVCKDD